MCCAPIFCDLIWTSFTKPFQASFCCPSSLFKETTPEEKVGFGRHISFFCGKSHFLGGGFRYLFIFIPIWGNDPIWLYNIFQMGWNHQLVLCNVYFIFVAVFSKVLIIIVFRKPSRKPEGCQIWFPDTWQQLDSWRYPDFPENSFEKLFEIFYLELQTTSALWLFQLDDSNLYMGNGCFTKSIKNWLFRVPGIKETRRLSSWIEFDILWLSWISLCRILLSLIHVIIDVEAANTTSCWIFGNPSLFILVYSLLWYMIL